MKHFIQSMAGKVSHMMDDDLATSERSGTFRIVVFSSITLSSAFIIFNMIKNILQ